jgi:hypothetical protein
LLWVSWRFHVRFVGAASIYTYGFYHALWLMQVPGGFHGGSMQVPGSCHGGDTPVN